MGFKLRFFGVARQASLPSLPMPLLQIQSSALSSNANENTPLLLKTLSGELARELGKPETYVMVSLTTATSMVFGGSPEPCCFAALKNIGTFAPAQTERLSALLCARLTEALGVPPHRIYIEFIEARDHLWGHDGATFA